jgi:nucleoside-triphosphatase THEP1
MDEGTPRLLLEGRPGIGKARWVVVVDELGRMELLAGRLTGEHRR